jgi:DNA-binding SARP family transcriptional activator
MRIEVLGGFRLWVGPRVTEEGRWRLRKANTLVKLLALSAGHRLHREQVIEALWPGLETKRGGALGLPPYMLEVF